MLESTAVRLAKVVSFGKLTEPQLKVWGVFLLCLIVTAIGVAATFLVFGSTLTGKPLWIVGVVIAVLMLGLSYGTKYADEAARASFTPVDLIQYLSQGFLWPSAWPAMAERLGMVIVQPPPEGGTSAPQSLLELGQVISSILG